MYEKPSMRYIFVNKCIRRYLEMFFFFVLLGGVFVIEFLEFYSESQIIVGHLHMHTTINTYICININIII